MTLPRENLIRAVDPGASGLRVEPGVGGQGRTLHGDLIRFNEWAEINSIFEGRFLERFAPGALAKTIAENRQRMRVLFHHGRDPQVGVKPLGPIARLGETGDRVSYEVQLLDTDYVRELIPGLEAGQYGTSFRFDVVRDEIVRRPGRSGHNPEGLPERTVIEARVPEFGPTPFPAYAGTSAAVRSATDEFRGLGKTWTPSERRRALLEAMR
jgi:phage head maturation protease